jgi:L-aspartate oxidase
MNDIETIEADFLVIGTGLAGLTFALKAAEFGRVAVVTKKGEAESNTNMAQGGIAAVTRSDDSFELHARDTLRTGCGLSHEDAVEILVREGLDRIQDLIDLGVPFNVEVVGGKEELAVAREGGHSVRRIVHAGDLTGAAIESTLLSAAKRNWQIAIFENHLATRLYVAQDNGTKRCLGAEALDVATNRLKRFTAPATCLATGGLAQVYIHTTNPPIATGDGVAIAYEVGAQVANMEFVQFHPTSLFRAGGRPFLISEAVRGEGAVLRLADGARFMEKYNPAAELAPRDVVARAIDNELKSRGESCCYLDLTHLDSAFVRERFPTIYSTLLGYGIDMTREMIPVVPAAHYSCGGVRTDTWGRSNIEGLYACGEVACTGVHGANRLASNSLPEALVFAHRAAGNAIEKLKNRHLVAPSAAQLPDPAAAPACKANLQRIAAIAHSIRYAMWEYVGIVRSDERLSEAESRLGAAATEIEEMNRKCAPCVEAIEAANLAAAAGLITKSAMARKESRGLHYTLDYPEPDDEHFKRDTILCEGEEVFL